MNLDKKQRNLYLDIMKGISIFLVLLGHSIQYGSKISYVGSRLFFNDPVFKLIYSFHMPLFALLSGYLFFYTIKKRTPKELVINRVKTLVLPIICWGTIDFAVRILTGQLNGSGIIWWVKRYVITLFGTLWFLWAILLCSAIVAGIHYLFRDNKAVMLLLMIAFFITPDKFNLGYMKFLYPFFVAGYMWNLHGVRVSNKIQKVVLIVSGFVLLILLRFMQTGTYIYISGFAILGKENPWIQMYYDLYRWTIGFAGSVFVLSGINLLMNVTVNKFKTAKNLGGGVGTLSMGIYAVQGYVFQYVIIPVFAIVGVDVPFILVIVEALLILGICCGITLFLKKIKPLSICLLGGR